MSFEKIISDRNVYLPYREPGSEELKWVDFPKGEVVRVETATLAAISARKNSPLDAYFEKGILRKVKRSNADVIEPGKAPAQMIAEKLANGEEVDGNFGGESVEDIRPSKPLPSPFRGVKR